MQTYSAYCVPLDDGGFGMCVFMESFVSVEEAQHCLQTLFDNPLMHIEQNGTMH